MGRPLKLYRFSSSWYVWALILPLVVLMPYLNSFPYPNTETTFSDLTITHYPQTVYLRKSLIMDHRLPLWSPNILSGHPLVGNPLSGLWYPPGWIALLVPLPLGFNVGVILHLLWGGIGMMTLARLEGRSKLAALFAGIAMIALPKLYAHYGAGHLTLIYAIAWTPWLLYTSKLSFKSNISPGIPAVIMALIILADPRWAIFSAGLWWAYAFFQKLNPEFDQPFHRKLRLLISQSIMGLGLAAPLIIPFIEFVNLTSRVGMSAEDVFSFSLPPARLLGLVFPDFGGFHEWILYPGVIVILLVILGFAWRKTMVGINFWFWIMLLSLVISLGSFLPYSDALGQLPVVRLLRVPSRALFVTGMAMVMQATYTIDTLLNNEQIPNLRTSKLLLVFMSSLIFALGLAGWFFGGDAALGFLWGCLGVVIAAVWIWLGIRNRFRPEIWLLILIVLCLVDWGMMDRSLFDPRPAKDVLAEKVDLVSFIADQPGQFRVYSPSYSLPQHTASDFDLQLADGVDPLQLQSYVNFMREATGVPWDGYSVTLPPFANGEPRSDNAGYLPDPKKLGWLNVNYIASEFQLNVEGLKFVSKFEHTYLYENTQAQARAWVQPRIGDIAFENQPAKIIKWTPERIELKGEGPGVLVISELAYPGWRVWVDNEEAQILTIMNLLRGVKLEPGEHTVIFEFRPSSIYLGVGLALLVCSIQTGLHIVTKRKSL